MPSDQYVLIFMLNLIWFGLVWFEKFRVNFVVGGVMKVYYKLSLFFNFHVCVYSIPYAVGVTGISLSLHSFSKLNHNVVVHIFRLRHGLRHTCRSLHNCVWSLHVIQSQLVQSFYLVSCSHLIVHGYNCSCQSTLYQNEVAMTLILPMNSFLLRLP